VTDTDYRGASAAAIRHHYDLGNDFFALWLDTTRTYSCALFDPTALDDTLESAQARKFDYIAEQAQADGAGVVLDVGCGWGGMMRRLLDRHGVGRTVGLTLSDAQADYVRSLGDDRIDVRVQNWLDHPVDAHFDAIVSLGAFEHFADFGMRPADRIEAYRQFFRRCHGWLDNRARLVVQTNVKGTAHGLTRQMVRDQLFIVDRIFPESEIPWPSEIFEASRDLFDVVCLRNDPDMYSRTTAMWRDNLRAHQAEAESVVGAEAVDDYDRYLSSFSDAYARRHLGLMRITFERL
jgi:cyclopropane-fatty-acyl-phospholipid synthase